MNVIEARPSYSYETIERIYDEDGKHIKSIQKHVVTGELREIKMLDWDKWELDRDWLQRMGIKVDKK